MATLVALLVPELLQPPHDRVASLTRPDAVKAYESTFPKRVLGKTVAQSGPVALVVSPTIVDDVFRDGESVDDARGSGGGYYGRSTRSARRTQPGTGIGC
jgi:hypothetical protein